MKTKIMHAFLGALFLIASMGLSGQTIELFGFTGYQLGGRAKFFDGDFRIENAQNYGGKVAMEVANGTALELSYMRADTRGRFVPFTGAPSEYVPFSTNYIQLGGLQQLDLGPVSPFATVSAGLTVWSPKNSLLESKTQFSVTAGAGLKI